MQIKPNVNLKLAGPQLKSRPDSELNQVTNENKTASNKNEVPDGATCHTKPSLPHGTITVDKKIDFLKLQSCFEDPVT